MFIVFKQVDKQGAAASKVDFWFLRGRIKLYLYISQSNYVEQLFFFIVTYLFFGMFLQVLIHGASTNELLLSTILFSLLCYLSYARYQRYKFVNSIIRKYPDPNIVLENHDIATEIYSNIFRKEFPCKFAILQKKIYF